jgi:hypothetical protein
MKIVYGQTDTVVVFQTDDKEHCCIISFPSGIDEKKEIKKLQKLYQKGEYPFDIVDYYILDRHNDLPKEETDKHFAEAWIISEDNTKVIVDLDKAKKIHEERVREVRDKALEETDKEYVRESSKGLDVTEINTRKQYLRDIPQNLDLSHCDCTGDIFNNWPEGLDRPDYYK